MESDAQLFSYQDSIYKDVIISLILSLDWSCVESNDEHVKYIETSYQKKILTIEKTLTDQEYCLKKKGISIFYRQK